MRRAAPVTTAQAEQDAAQAGQELTALQDRVRTGDPDVTPEHLAQHHASAEFTRLRVEAAAAAQNQAAAAARLTQLRELRAEVDQTAAGGLGHQLADLATGLIRAVDEFATALHERNARLAAWQQRMRQLGVPMHTTPLPPPDQHGELGYSGAYMVIAGSRRLADMDPVEALSRVLCSSVHGYAAVSRRPADSPGSDPATWLERLDVTAPPPPAGTRFFRTTGGGVVELDHEPSDGERQGITGEITREQAWGR